jgi:hypothetical protein
MIRRGCGLQYYIMVVKKWMTVIAGGRVWGRC